MGRLQERFGGAAVSRFDLVDSSKKGSTKAERDELSLKRWYDSCQSSTPGDFSHDFFCREWPDSPVLSRAGLLPSEPISNEDECSLRDEDFQNASEEKTLFEKTNEGASARSSSTRSGSGSSSNNSSSGGAGDRALLLLPSAGHGETQYVPAQYVSQHVRRQQYHQLCFEPTSRLTGDATGGLEAGEMIGSVSRSRSEEGLYTGSRPQVAPGNLSKMVARLEAQGSCDWLTGEDGSGDLLQDAPVESTRYRRHAHHTAGDSGAPLARFVEAGTQVPSTLSSHCSCSLRLLLSALQFQHHPLQAAEQVLAMRLTATVTQYAARQGSRQTELLWQKLQVLRSSMLRLQQLHPELSHQQGHDPTASTTIRAEVDYNRRSELYRASLHNTRQQLHASGRRDRLLLTEALDAWAQIKQLREEQGYVVTPVTLVIRKMKTPSPVSTELNRWTESQEAEVNERLEEQRRLHTRAQKRYEDDLKLWQQQHKARKAARRRQQRWLAAGCSGSEAAVLQAARDQLALGVREPEQPRPPEQPHSREQVSRAVEVVFNESHRPPGEPLLELQLTSDWQQVTPAGDCPLQEKRRRQVLAVTSVAIKVLVNNKVVTQTPWRRLDCGSFGATLDYPVHASLTAPPLSLSLQLLESTSSTAASTAAWVGAAVGSALRSSSTVAVAQVPLKDGRPHLNSDGEADVSDGGNAGEACAGEARAGDCGEPSDGQGLEERLPAKGEQLSVKFTSNKVVCHSHAGVGASVAGAKFGYPATQATLTFGYSLSAGALLAASPVHQAAPRRAPESADQLDPNDPQNARAAAARTTNSANNKNNNTSDDGEEPRHHGGERGGEGGYFECDGESVGPSWFCSRQQLDSNLRLKMLQLRERKVPEFQGLQRIPALSSQILRSTVWEYEAKQASSSTLQEDCTDPDGGYGATGFSGGGECEDEDWLDDVAERMAAAERLVSSVRRRLLHQTAEAAAVPTPADMVQEEQIPDIGSLGTSLVSMLRPKRPLKPDRRVRGAVRGAGLTGRKVKLIVSVARAFNVPTRDQGDHDGSRGLVRPFVTVSFQGRQSRTSVADGPNPTWNQQLVLPFRAPNDDYSSISLGLVRENIVLQLYDERLLDVTPDQPSTSTTRTDRDDDQVHDAGGDGAAAHTSTSTNSSSLHTRIHNTWLASLTIPTSALLHSSKIEGTFEVCSPVSVLGYSRLGGDPPAGGAGSAAGGGLLGRPPATHATHLTLYITLEPTLPQPQLIKGLHPCHEPPAIVAAAAAWQDGLSARHPGRHYQSHVLTMAGQLVAMDRFLRPLQPPPHLLLEESPEQTQCRVAWFVSLLPALPDMSLLPGTPPITASSEQLVNLVCGGEAERAVLLTNYFLYLGYTAYLLIGSSVSQGHYSCVLVKAGPPSPATAAPGGDGGSTSVDTASKGGSWRIWCPATGRPYSTRDPFCPVKAVYMLISQHNVWGNSQRVEDPARVVFTVHDSSCWRPLYSNSGATQRPQLASLQPPAIHYAPQAPHHDRELRDKLTLIVRDAFMKWRPHHRTVWNRHTCDVLRGLVRRLEAPRAAGGTAPPPSSQLTRLHHSHSVCGVCIQQGWRGVTALLAAVHSSDVHSCTLPGVEFALAVHTQPYPARVTSVWLYVASLVRRTQ